MKKTKIICSIGPASTDPAVMSKMVEAGMNVARINMSHATPEEKVAVVASVKEVRKMTGKNVAILFDTKGPEFRNGMLENDQITLTEGETIRIVKESVLGNQERFSVNYPQAIDNLEIGSIVLLENGLMKIEVISKEEDGVTCKIINGGVLGNKKSLNVPGANLNIPFISDVDREDIIYACEHEGDYLAASFVSSKEDVLEVREILKQCNREDMKIISKIESARAIENLDEIIDVTDGIMVARGDLGVEVPMQQLPKFQKLIIEKCREKGKSVVVATEMLESMKKSARPTRAEVSDVANAIYDGTSAIMLSGETAAGEHPVESVRTMAKIARMTEKNIHYKKRFQAHKKIKNTSITDAVSHAACTMAMDLEAAAIVAVTTTGHTARMLSKFRPSCPIIAVVVDEKAYHQTAMTWGTIPVKNDMQETMDDMFESAVRKAITTRILKKDDMIVLTGGLPVGISGTTNVVKVQIL